jgi:hypothetical protein
VDGRGGRLVGAAAGHVPVAGCGTRGDGLGVVIADAAAWGFALADCHDPLRRRVRNPDTSCNEREKIDWRPVEPRAFPTRPRRAIRRIRTRTAALRTASRSTLARPFIAA